MSNRPCAYYEVRSGWLGASPGRKQQARAQDFYIDDPSGSALVLMKRYDVTLVAERHEQAIAALDLDVNEVSGRLRAIKRELRHADPGRAKALQAVRRRDKRLATLLCAIRAQSRGRLHSKTNLAAQAAFISSERAEFGDQEPDDGALAGMLVKRWEALIEPGQYVVVEGYCRWEPTHDPAKAEIGGYRGTPLQLTVQAPADSDLLVGSPDALDRPLPVPVEPAHIKRGAPGKSKRRRLLWLAVIAGLSALIAALI